MSYTKTAPVIQQSARIWSTALWKVYECSFYSILLRYWMAIYVESSRDICSRRWTHCTVITALDDDTWHTTAASSSLVLEQVGLERALERWERIPLSLDCIPSLADLGIFRRGWLWKPERAKRASIEGFGSMRGTKRHRNNLSHTHNNNMK